MISLALINSGTLTDDRLKIASIVWTVGGFVSQLLGVKCGTHSNESIVKIKSVPSFKLISVVGFCAVFKIRTGVSNTVT